MKTQNLFWWFVSVAIAAIAMALIAIGLLFWQQLTLEQKELLQAIVKEHFAFFFTAALLLFSAFGFALDWVFRFYIIPVNQLAEQTNLLLKTNPELKINVDGSHDIMRLADIINQYAGQSIAIHHSVQEQLKATRLDSEIERNVLASLLEDLPQGIVACNNEGNIVFYNRKARELLAERVLTPHSDDPADGRRWFGLGRSVYAFIDRALIVPALDRIVRKLDENQRVVHERFLVEIRSRELLPAEIIPVLDSQHHLTGFILYIEDQGARLQEEKRYSEKLQQWKHQLSQRVAVIKSSAEILADAAPVSIREEYRHLIRLLAEQAHSVAVLLTREDVTARWRSDQPLPLTPMDASEWARLLAQRATETLKVRVRLEENRLRRHISIDIHHLTTSMLFIIDRVTHKTGQQPLQAKAYVRESWIYFDLVWRGDPIDNEMLGHLLHSFPKVDGIELTIPLYEILDVHGAKLWRIMAELPPDHSGIRLLLPALEDVQMIDFNGRTTFLPESRPEFYDFDLFKYAGQHHELDDKALKDLIYTIFDTETTGLDPRGGDEIISIGAIRMVNGRLLRNETFEQLIDPQRPLPWASVKFHGIRPEMLAGQPSIAEVLPRFHQFAKDTVLIGHNVAFDMCMLQMKEAQTGIRFTNPLIDTMLLSDIVHPAHQKHSLRAVADRLGVCITGRHTALGDALATGEIFIKLLPLLGAMGIHTLKEARLASEKSLYARLKY